MVGWINAQQIVIHLPMLLVSLPENVSSHMAMILPVMTFDLLPSGISTELLIEFDTDNHEQFAEKNVLDQMRDIGYDTSNSI